MLELYKINYNDVTFKQCKEFVLYLLNRNYSYEHVLC